MSRVLVADDEQFVSDMIAEVLSGHDLAFVKCGEDALKLLQQSPDGYDLLVTDWSMKEAAMNGPELILAVRADSRLERIPIVLHSSHSEPPKELKGVEFTYVKKEFNTNLAPLLEQ